MSWREGLQLGAFPSWGTQRLFSVKYATGSEKQIFPRFFYYLEKTKKF